MERNGVHPFPTFPRDPPASFASLSPSCVAGSRHELRVQHSRPCPHHALHRPSPLSMRNAVCTVLGGYALRVERVYSSMSSGTDGGGANPTTGTRPLTTLLLRLDYSYTTPLYRFYCRHPRAGAAAHTRVHQAPGLISSSRAKQGMPPPLYVRRIHAAVACERSLA